MWRAVGGTTFLSTCWLSCSSKCSKRSTCGCCQSSQVLSCSSSRNYLHHIRWLRLCGDGPVVLAPAPFATLQSTLNDDYACDLQLTHSGNSGAQQRPSGGGLHSMLCKAGRWGAAQLLDLFVECLCFDPKLDAERVMQRHRPSCQG